MGKIEVLGYFIEFTAVYIIQLFFSTNDHVTHSLSMLFLVNEGSMAESQIVYLIECLQFKIFKFGHGFLACFEEHKMLLNHNTHIKFCTNVFAFLPVYSCVFFLQLCRMLIQEVYRLKLEIFNINVSEHHSYLSFTHLIATTRNTLVIKYLLFLNIYQPDSLYSVFVRRQHSKTTTHPNVK